VEYQEARPDRGTKHQELAAQRIMKHFTFIACSLLALGLAACSKPPQTDYFSGQWAAVNTPLYLDIRRDSLSFIGHVPPTDWSDYRANPSPQDPHGWKGPFFQPPSAPFGFTIGKSGELVLHLYHNLLDTLGRATQDQDTLFLQRRNEPHEIRLIHLHADTTIHLRKIQFSASGNPGDSPEYDLELRAGSMIVAVHEGRPEGPIAYYSASFSQEAFRRCEEITREANRMFPRSRFERFMQAGSGSPEYGLTVDFNDSSYTVLADDHQFPSELLPLIPYLTSPLGRSPITRKDTTMEFRSRLRLHPGSGNASASRGDVEHKGPSVLRFP